MVFKGRVVIDQSVFRAMAGGGKPYLDGWEPNWQ